MRLIHHWRRAARKKKYLLELSEKEREYLHKLISSGTASARKLNRACILLKADVVTGKHADAQALSDRQIARMLCRPPLPLSNKGRANASTREDSMPRWNALSPIGSTSVLFGRACRSAPDRPGLLRTSTRAKSLVFEVAGGQSGGTGHRGEGLP